MNLQQMEYIVALDKYRHFVLAAEACGVTQPTLSAMIQKLEEELDVKIFERSRRSVVPTNIGVKIIRQAQTALNETQRIKEVVADETGAMNGSLHIGIVPTIAPYIVPDFIYHFQHAYPNMKLHLDERDNKGLLQELAYGNLDMIMTTSPLEGTSLLEIPVYVERFVVYFSEGCQWDTLPSGPGMLLPADQMWVLKEGHCVHGEATSFCKNQEVGNHVYEAGSIETLIRIVDRNGGYTIIPELHVGFLTDKQREHVRPIESMPSPQRRISIFLKEDFVRERAVNAVRETLLKIIPARMLDERFGKHDIRLRRSRN